jgi:hypothetical protein
MCHYFTEPFPYTEAFSILLIRQGPSSQSTRMHFKTRLLVTASKALLSYCICITNAVPSRFDPYCFQPFQIFRTLSGLVSGWVTLRSVFAKNKTVIWTLGLNPWLQTWVCNVRMVCKASSDVVIIPVARSAILNLDNRWQVYYWKASLYSLNLLNAGMYWVVSSLTSRTEGTRFK